MVYLPSSTIKDIKFNLMYIGEYAMHGFYLYITVNPPTKKYGHVKLTSSDHVFGRFHDSFREWQPGMEAYFPLKTDHFQHAMYFFCARIPPPPIPRKTNSHSAINNKLTGFVQLS